MSINKQVSGQGKDVVLIHGWGCDLRHMQPIADQLKGYRITNVDLPGRGKSDWAPSIDNIHDIADFLLPELPESAIYVPWSFGGLVTLSIASRYPERVSRIIGVATSPKFIEDDGWPAVPKPGFIAGFSEITQLGFVDFFKAYYDVEFSDFNPKPKEYQKLIDLLEKTPKQDLDVLLQGVRLCDKTDFRDRFKTLKCPVDLILGGKDSSVPSAMHPAIQRLNPAAKLHVIPEAQHMSFWTHPLAF
ncbi:MAG: hypothetical protein COW05_09815, partial [Gammaproteobacteria bacterium CG12_big_fil_rev_8_21_14_0_65_46_12]